MLLTLTARHFDQTRGKAHAVPLRHPNILNRINGRSRITLWFDGQPLSRIAGSIQDVAERGGGLCHLNMPNETSDLPPGQCGGMLWLSLPGDVDPRHRPDGVVVELSEVDAAAATGRPCDGGPLLIVGAQRTGTTALQTALEVTTPYRAPRDACLHRWHTLEGFFTIQSMCHWLTHPFVSPLGTDADHRRFRTGMFDDSAFASDMLDSLAAHLGRSGSMLAQGSPCWIEKCPGWETSSLGPLFASLFPGARVIYMTRDPVSCSMSIARLENSLPQSPTNDADLRAIARNSAVWVISHLIWRRYARTRLGSGQMLEVPFGLFQSRPAEIVPSLARFLQLTDQQGEALLDALGRIPTKQHPIAIEEIDPVVLSMFRRLCRTEAAHWGYETGPCEPVDPATLQHVLRLFRAQLAHMLDWYQVRRDVTDALVEINARGALDAPLQAADAASEATAEPPIPPAPSLLLCRLTQARALCASERQWTARPSPATLG